MPIEPILCGGNVIWGRIVIDWSGSYLTKNLYNISMIILLWF